MKKLLLIILIGFRFLVYAQILFQDQSSMRGLTQNTGVVSMGGGISFADFDNDGLDDISLGTGNGQSVLFYKNYGGFFAQVDLLPVDLDFQNKAITWVDFDNDGDKDLFVASQTNGNVLFERQSDNTFLDITSSAGFVTENMFTYGVSWGDVNNDGCLDVYLSNRVEFNTTITNYFYLNNCDGTFTEVTDMVGLSNTPALTFCSAFFDFNNDGWTDLYIANDKVGQNYLFKNNGDGTFSDVSASSGTDLVIDAMSVTIDDYNNDGYFDIFMTNTPNVEATTIGSTILLKNNGDETFTSVSASADVQLDSWSWGASFFDADNDQDLDLYVSCSYDGSFGYPSYGFYENMANGTFQGTTIVGLDNSGESFASAVGDLDNDGLEDILVINNNQEPFLWKNETTTSNNFLKIKLVGTTSNREGVGARIEITTCNDFNQYRYTMCGEGYLSQNSSIENIGVGSCDSVEKIKIFWPSGIVDIMTNVSVNQTLTITETNILSVDEFDGQLALSSNNPINNLLSLSSNQIIKKINIYDIVGKMVLEKNINQKEVMVNVSILNSGVFLCKVEFSDGKNQTIKLVKK